MDRIFKKKMSVWIIWGTILSVVVCVFFAYIYSKYKVEGEENVRMSNSVYRLSEVLERECELQERTTQNMADVIKNSFDELDLDKSKKLLEAFTKGDKHINSMGIWFEPFYYQNQKHFAPVYQKVLNEYTFYDYSMIDSGYRNNEWYIKGRKNPKESSWSEVYIDNNKTKVARIVTPILIDNVFVGCITMDLSLDKISELVKNIEVKSPRHVFLLDSNGYYLSDRDKSKQMWDVSIEEDTTEGLSELADKIFNSEYGTEKFRDKDDKIRILSYAKIEKMGWVAGLITPARIVNDKIIASTIFISIIGTGIILTFFFLITLIYMNYGKKLKKVEKIIQSAANGDYTDSVLEHKKSYTTDIEFNVDKIIFSQNKDFNSLKKCADEISNLTEEIEGRSQKIYRNTKIGVRNTLIEMAKNNDNEPLKRDFWEEILNCSNDISGISEQIEFLSQEMNRVISEYKLKS